MRATVCSLCMAESEVAVFPATYRCLACGHVGSLFERAVPQDRLLASLRAYAALVNEANRGPFRGPNAKFHRLMLARFAAEVRRRESDGQRRQAI